MENSQSCKTKFPILLLHGLNCRDEKPVFYFGRIPNALTKQGAKVYLGGQDAWGTIESNALQIMNRIAVIVATEKCEKVNIIAHSKGGLEARYLVSALMQQDRVASISTISTPHMGTKTAEKWIAYSRMLRAIGVVFNSCWKFLGDENPDFVAVIHSLTPKSMQQFNEKYMNSPSIYYQSWGASMNDSRDDRVMRILKLFFYKLDGENDGLVSPKSAQWGHYNGTIENISHQDIVDCRKKDLKHFSTIDFYMKIVHQLAERGL